MTAQARAKKSGIRRRVRQFFKRKSVKPVPLKAIQPMKTILEVALTPKQRADYAESESFYVKGGSGLIYRVRRGVSYTEVEVPGVKDPMFPGRPWSLSLCVQMRMTEGCLGVTGDDKALARKLCIEADEAGFLEAAGAPRWARGWPIWRAYEKALRARTEGER